MQDEESVTMLATDKASVEDAAFYTACTNCKGKGKLVLPPTKKQRIRHKRARLQATETDTPQPKPIPPRLEGCTACTGSGVLESLAETPINRHFPTLAIVGGGLGGLALATACRHYGIAAHVYERDAHFSQRSQGYGLTMQQAVTALAAFGIDTLQDGITSTKHVVHRQDGTVVGEWGLRKWGSRSSSTTAAATNNNNKAKARQNVHVARQSLRYELLQAAGGANATNIHWNHRLLELKESAGSDGDGDSAAATSVMKLSFQVGDKQVERHADLVIGADGIRSVVRQALIGDERMPLRYLGCIVILGICELTETVRASSELLDGETVFQTADGTVRIYMMPYSATEYMWQLSYPMDEQEAASLSKQGAHALKEQAIAKCHSWHSPVPQILHTTPASLVSGYPVYDRALLTTDMMEPVEKRRVTLIGDAAHPMSPFKGQGANQALLDALSLARSLYESFAPTVAKESFDTQADIATATTSTALSKALSRFEEEMLARSATKVQASAEAAQFLHTSVAIQEGNVTRGAANTKNEGANNNNDS